MARYAKVDRTTKETQIQIEIELDGKGEVNIDTGIGFFDHMLTLLGIHGRFDLKIKAKGDLDVDYHHTVEDTGIVLGRALAKAYGDKISIKRYGVSYIPMDEALSRVVVDLSSRPFLIMKTDCPVEKIGQMDSELFEEFFRAIAFNAGMTLHIETFYGTNGHHIYESVFKAFGRALKESCMIDCEINGVMSSKGTFL